MRIKGTLPQRQLARALRQLREDAGLSLEEAAPRLDWSSSKLSRIETAQQGVDVHWVRSMLDLYHVGGPQWDEIIDLTREARSTSSQRPERSGGQGYRRLEADAAVVHQYQLAYVPGLLQIEGYMRALFRDSWRCVTEAEIDLDVQERLARQRRLIENPTLDLVAIVDESALHRPIGGVEAMRAQLRHLVVAADLPSVCLQVLPISIGVHCGMNGSFVLLGFGDPDEPDVAYVEHTPAALHLQKEAEVYTCRLVFDRLRSKALSPHDSVALIERLAAEF